MSQLIDGFGRSHDNLRISVTDRCNLRCTYCMPEHVEFMDRGELLTFEEIGRLAGIAIDLGLTKIRLTGGEPLLRKDLFRLVEMLTRLPGLRDLSLTTNAVLLSRQAHQLFDAGLRRLNISLDTLDRERFKDLTRRDALDEVLNGIDVARALGFEPIKVNAVCIRGVNDPDVVPLARFAQANGIEMRYIEYMPIGADQWERSKVLYASEILERIEAELGPLIPAKDNDPRAPATRFRYAEGKGVIGIIASVSRPFCMRCNRLRLTAEGKLRNCLFAHEEADVRALVRGGAGNQAIGRVIRECVQAKGEGHEINTARFIKPLRTMHAIGG